MSSLSTFLVRRHLNHGSAKKVLDGGDLIPSLLPAFFFFSFPKSILSSDFAYQVDI